MGIVSGYKPNKDRPNDRISLRQVIVDQFRLNRLSQAVGVDRGSVLLSESQFRYSSMLPENWMSEGRENYSVSLSRLDVHESAPK